MEATSNATFVLKRNHRAWRRAAEFVTGAFYGRDMSIVYRIPTKATGSFKDCLKATFNARGTAIMLRPKVVGFSFANYYHANYVVQLIIQMYRGGKILNAARTRLFLCDAVLL
jgi:hypothetical protein